MLIEYRVKNFMSYKDEVVLSMVADKNRELSETNVFTHGKLSLLKTAAIFGANASGKSNLIESMNYLCRLMHPSSSKKDEFAEPPVFKLDDVSRNQPVEFELSFFLGEVRHRYGLTIDRKGIVSEWLYFVPKRQEACYFVRERNELTQIGTYFEDKKALDYIRPDSYRPFIYTLGQDSVKQFGWAKDIIRYLRIQIKSSNIPDVIFRRMVEEELLEQSEQSVVTKSAVLSILRDADIGISDLSVEKETKSSEEQEMARQFTEFLQQQGVSGDIQTDSYETFMHHMKYDAARKEMGEEKFPIRYESRGTIKLYALQYPILNVLKRGGVLLVDEIESSLHPLLCERIIALFNNTATNPHHAQLIFTTHNTLLMHPRILRRDQIFFTEKNKYGVSSLYSLYDIAIDVRNNFNYLNNYLAGRFGAIPYLGEFSLNFKEDEVAGIEEQTE
ncbi:AAA family ATPase [Cohnella fermenti]|nr:ATP-binding protein [Cohnella fermenti]